MVSDDASSDGFGSMLDRSRTQLDRSLLSHRVYSMLRNSILNGDLAPGQRVVESEIARRLAVSQAPVREAVKRLAHEGLLTYRPRHGNYVTEVSPEEAHQAREVRVSLEELAGRLAAENADSRELDELDALVTAMRAAADQGDVGRFRDLDIAFHAKVCEAAHNVYLLRVRAVIEPSLRTLWAIADPMFEGDWSAMADEHGRLVELIKSRDAQASAAECARHADRRSPVADAHSTVAPDSVSQT